MSEKIKITYHNDLVYEMSMEQPITRPQPAKNFLPEWFKKIEPYAKSEENPNGKNIIIEGESNATAKKCTPMLDGMICGYIIPLWCDVQVRQEKLDGTFYPRITWRTRTSVFSLHTNTSTVQIPAPIGYTNVCVFKYSTYFTIKTPKGYSISVFSPTGYRNLPFYAIPAVIDSDKSVIDNNFPCWVQEGFEGIVEKGTPIAQILPFKRDDWSMNFSKIDAEQHTKDVEKGFHSNILNNYVRNIWSKKTYT